MKQVILSVLLFVSCYLLQAQKHDYVWLSGYYSDIGFDTGWGFYFGATVIDYKSFPAQISYDSIEMNLTNTNASFSDTNGNLLFYTNGLFIANAYNEKIEGSDSLNAGYYRYIFDPNVEKGGYPISQGIIALPSPNDSNQYYLFHTLRDINQAGTAHCISSLLVTLLDMSANAGHGKVVYKNKLVIKADNVAPDLTAVKHANGKDWWLPVQKRNTNCFYRVLLDSTGVSVDSFCTGSSYPMWYQFEGTSCFTPDGSKYATVSMAGGLNIYDFDRCSGMLSNNVHLDLNATRDSGWIAMGVSFSPNSRFLYVGLTRHLYQLDLSETDVLSSIDTIGYWDGSLMPFETWFNTSQLAPDGKIYISCGNADTVYHVIERPDEKGDSCLLRQHGLSLITPSVGVPNFPNYRLGPLAVCDTFTDIKHQELESVEKQIKLYPNPTTDVITIDYGLIDWSKGEATLEISNQLWQVVYKQNPPMYSGFQKINLTDFSAGFYTVYIRRNNQVIASSKFAKQ